MPRSLKRKIIRLFSYLKPASGVVFFLILVFILWKVLFPVFSFMGKEQLTPAFFSSLFFNRGNLLHSYRDRTNVLVLGIAGGDHGGADLTDTMLLISVDPGKPDGIFVSVPRDIWLDSLKDKINSAYHYGEQRHKGGGFILAKAAVEEVIGQPIHYALVIDFSGFKKLVDQLGGVDINVINGFTDNLYPIQGRENDLCGGDRTFACRYEKLTFTPGLQHMDGERVLKFVRSRHAEGEEGTDFARGRRQQQMIVALKNKILSPEFLFHNLNNSGKLFTLINNSVSSDMTLGNRIIFARYFLILKDWQTRHLILDDGDQLTGRKGFLKNPPLSDYNGEWVLVPRTGNFNEIHTFIDCQFKNLSCLMKP